MMVDESERTIARAKLAKRIAEVYAPTPEAQEQLRQIAAPYVKISSEVADMMQGIYNIVDQNQDKMLGFASQLETFNSGLYKIAAEFAKTLPPPEVFERWAKVNAQRDRLSEIGFLPHRLMSPILEDDTLAGTALSDAIEARFRGNWPEIQTELTASVEGCDVDEEAKATFREALASHGLGHYRSVCRVLFPEFERVIRYDIHGGQLKGLASLRNFRDLVGELGLSTMTKLGGMSALVIIEQLLERLYQKAEEQAQIEDFRNDPIPNRHACIHGILVYNTAKNSINMIVMAEFIFRTVSLLKDGEEDDGVEAVLVTPPASSEPGGGSEGPAGAE